MTERKKGSTSQLRYCWIRNGIYGVDEESDPAGFATSKCQFRLGDGIITEERFYCTHPNAHDKKLAEYCKPSLLRLSNRKRK